MSDASRSFAVSARGSRLLPRIVLQRDDGIRPDLVGRFFIAVLNETERSSDYRVINSLSVIRSFVICCSRKKWHYNEKRSENRRLISEIKNIN